MSLSMMINKTPLSNKKSNIYELDQFGHNLLQQLTQSRFSGEGVFCLEQLSMPDYSEQYLITPSFDKYTNKPTDKVWNLKEDVKEAVVFELVLEKPSFMPLDTTQFIDLFNQILTIPQGSVLTQVLFCKRLDNWREVAISQYEQFLKGNENPLSSKFTIKLQEKVLNVFAKFNNFQVKRDPIEEIEQKILQNNYRFECRFVLFEEKYTNIFVSEIQKILQKLNLFNEFVVKKVRNVRNFVKFIENREFQVELVNQLLSEEELYSLLCDTKSSVTTKVELEKPVKQQSVLRNLEDSMLLQRATQLMPFKERENKETEIAKAELVNKAFKRVGIVTKSLKISEVYQGSTLLKVQMIIPPDITFTQIKKKLVDVQAAMGNEGVSIEIGDKPDTINVFIPLEQREVLYFRQLLESEEFQQFKKDHPLPFIIGENANGGFMFHDLSELRHLLITGATGSGKSVFVNLLLLSLILCVPPDELSMYLIDPKQVEYSMFDGFPQVKKIITDMSEANKLLESLCMEMENRYAAFAKSGVKNIITYNKNQNVKMPFIVVGIDEYADLVMVNPNVEDYLVRLGQKARAAGIHMIICTQKPLSDIVTSVLKSNLPSAFSFRLKTSTDYVTVFGKGIPYNLLGRGDGVCKLEGQMKEYERFQSPLLTLDEDMEDDIYRQLKELFKDVTLDSEELPEIESEIDKLKRIIATTNELRVSELQSKMGIAIGKVKELLTELVSEGWLKQEGKGRPYEINADEEELSKWRETK
jgi:DNA segregation ATPase FtsK/SpoIIIE, S-DNA-T family